MSVGTVESVSCRYSANGLLVVSVLFHAGQKLTAMIRLAKIRPRLSKAVSQKPASADCERCHAAMTRVSSPKAGAVTGSGWACRADRNNRFSWSSRGFMDSPSLANYSDDAIALALEKPAP